MGYYNFSSQGPYRGRLLTHELNYGFQHHVSRQFVALVRAAAGNGADVPLLKERIQDEVIELPEFVPTSAAREEVRALLREAAGADPKQLLLLNPNCSDLLPLRRWSDERWVELGKRLLEELPDATIAVTGAPSEAEEAARIAQAIGSERAFSVAGRTSLQQLLVLYGLADLLVSNDSGPVHFAALTPVPVVALFGPETPLLYGPLSRRARVRPRRAGVQSLCQHPEPPDVALHGQSMHAAHHGGGRDGGRSRAARRLRQSFGRTAPRFRAGRGSRGTRSG